MARTLASIQKVTDIQPIAGADKIVRAQILGWQCVVKKDEFNVGDAVVYVEVDSIMPERPEFDFLKDRNYRVKTIKLRGQISQGLVLPLSILPSQGLYTKWGIGQDVTELLGVTKYDPQADEETELMTTNVSRVTKFLRRFKWYRDIFMVKNEGGFPSWITKTDEIRIQNFPDICEREHNTILEVTEKLDGQSATYFLKREKFGRFTFGVCSRKIYLKNPENNNYWKIAKEFNIEKTLRSIIGKRDFVVLQGEIIGEGVQGNKYKIKGLDFYAFNLIFPDAHAGMINMRNLLMPHGIKVVPVIQMLWRLPATIEEAVEFSKGISWVHGSTQREGVVCRDPYRKPILSFKIINPEFLLKNNG
jgi:hypothetical protein